MKHNSRYPDVSSEIRGRGALVHDPHNSRSTDGVITSFVIPVRTTGFFFSSPWY